MNEVFLGSEALGAGMSRTVLRRWYRPMFRGVYTPKWAVPTLHDRALGAWLTSGRSGVITGVAASALHGADWVDDTEPIEVVILQHRRQPGLLIRMERIADDEITVIEGIPVATRARTAFDLGRHQRRPNALARLDALMRNSPFGRDEVAMLAERYGPVRGVRQLRELLPLIDPGAASPKESWLRLLLLDNGYPAPETQIPVLDESGEAFAYLDMGWRNIGLAVEYDGEQHQTSRSQYAKDHKRLPQIAKCGWEVIRVIAEDSKGDILERVGEAFARRGGAEIDDWARSTRENPPIWSNGRKVA
ncbi:hypothetical protein SBI67_04450 [Mycolicibacterium sp. 120266]|jgi:hypothetical protein|uniref:hypothetical protein n=1 Tax=Mycolicibacterium sp. 120266 TaxID=3090601 RepID=UPI00299DF79F|nr:hypothetical protein [Mycolicibacterium sp. 120266]MDX1871362.1 hypothetical protein [Mycolicibacterium sp. 120266]